MTREEFASLPPRIALEVLYDIAHAKLEPLTRPDVPRSPLFDGRLFRGNKGFTWMSEMSIRDLEWWEAKKRESAASGSQYSEKDAKTAQTLAAWLTWRRLFPGERWSGKRGDDRVTAEAPSDKPALHQWSRDANRGGGNKPAEPQDRDEENLEF